jgi:hypothetical protein
MMFAGLAVGVVGLTGIFATYATPLPLERAMAREAALDAALMAANSSDPKAALAALSPVLGDSAAALADAPAADFTARIWAERKAMRARFAAEAAQVATTLRYLVAVVTLTGGLFVVLIVGGLAKRP